jgi:hypothetical protein
MRETREERLKKLKKRFTRRKSTETGSAKTLEYSSYDCISR